MRFWMSLVLLSCLQVPALAQSAHPYDVAASNFRHLMHVLDVATKLHEGFLTVSNPSVELVQKDLRGLTLDLEQINLVLLDETRDVLAQFPPVNDNNKKIREHVFRNLKAARYAEQAFRDHLENIKKTVRWQLRKMRFNPPTSETEHAQRDAFVEIEAELMNLLNRPLILTNEAISQKLKSVDPA